MITAHQLYMSFNDNNISESEISSFDDKLGLGEAAIIAGDEDFVNIICPLLSDAELAFIDFRRAQLANDFHIAQNKLRECVEASRNGPTRNHQIEARARMEWGLLRFTQGESEEAGIDLRWAMERMKAISEGSVGHGMAILNMAAWHISRHESIMALALLSQINRLGPHKLEIIATSRLQISKILFEMGDFTASQRHAWVAFQGFTESGMVGEAVQAALIWLDLSLNEVTSDAMLMSQVVENAAPRNLGDSSQCCSNPDDMILVIKWCFDNWIEDNSGSNRPDLLVLIEAEKIVGLSHFKDKFRQDSTIEDKDVLKALDL